MYQYRKTVIKIGDDEQQQGKRSEMSVKNILILCTGNSARSIMTEYYFNHRAGDRYRAYSAGSNPTGKVHPIAIQTLDDYGIEIAEPRSISWNEFAGDDVPVMDLVITVCDNAANEVCPIWPGAPITLHWPFRDPAATPLNDPGIATEFAEVFAEIREKVDEFVATDN